MVIGTLIGLVGEVTPALQLLKFLVITDFFTGIVKGLIEKDINSRKLFMGGYRKALIFLVIIIANQIDNTFSDIYLRESAIIYYIINEGVSIMENISLYIPIPKELGKFFTDVKEDSENEDK